MEVTKPENTIGVELSRSQEACLNIAVILWGGHVASINHHLIHATVLFFPLTLPLATLHCWWNHCILCDCNTLPSHVFLTHVQNRTLQTRVLCRPARGLGTKSLPGTGQLEGLLDWASSVRGWWGRIMTRTPEMVMLNCFLSFFDAFLYFLMLNFFLDWKLLKLIDHYQSIFECIIFSKVKKKSLSPCSYKRKQLETNFSVKLHVVFLEYRNSKHLPVRIVLY